MNRHRTHTSSLLVMILVVVSAGACGDGSDASVTATPETALHYAQLCAETLGPIPTWACQEGVQIPILVDGQPVATTPSRCDNPDLKGECVVGSYAGRLVGQNVDGSPNADVSWAYFCRRDDDFAQMIGHNKVTGATCFFELDTGAMPLEDGVPKGKVPGVDSPDYEATWKRPDEVAVQRCNMCHTPDPFIHTPYVDAARWPTDPTEPVVPRLATTTSPYFVVGDAFADWTFDHVEFDDNRCTSCHRMPDFLRFTQGSGVDFNAHMPPLAPGSMKSDFDAVLACLTEGPDEAPGCRWAALNGATPTKTFGGPGGGTKPAAGSTFEAKGRFATTFGTLDATDPFAAGSGTFSGGEISPYEVGAISGPSGDAAVRIEVIGEQDFPNTPGGARYVARFDIPAASFSAGKVFDLAGGAVSAEVLFAFSGGSPPLGPVVGGSLTVVEAGSRSGDPVAGSFVVEWQDGK